MNFVIALGALLVVSVGAQDFECPATKGIFPDPYQCDKYYVCNEGVPKERLCPDGLVFDETIKRVGKCDQQFNVDCGDRLELQEPRGTSDYCPRKNGIYSHPDETICDVFFNCVDGEYSETKCTGGLHFDENSGTCVWPDTANRQNCQEQQRTLKDGFSCIANQNKNDPNGQVIAHPHYAHPEDCQKFYVCLNGVNARELTCGAGEVFSEETKRCDAPANVPGCEDWFAEVIE